MAMTTTKFTNNVLRAKAVSKTKVSRGKVPANPLPPGQSVPGKKRATTSINPASGRASVHKTNFKGSY